MSVTGRAEKVLEDLDFYFETVESVHPRPMGLLSPERYLHLKHTLRDFARQAAAAGSLPHASLAALLARAAASLSDSHSVVLLEELATEAFAPRPRLPFRLDYRAGQIRVGEAAAGLEHLRGGWLKSVNRTDFREFVKPALARISGDSEPFRFARFVDRQALYWAFTPVVGSASAEVAVQFGDRESVQRVPLLEPPEFEAQVGRPARGPVAEINPFRRLEDGVFCFQYNDFIESESERATIDDMFWRLRRESASSFLVDLRFSGGGSSKMAELLLQYLTAEPYRLYSRVDVRLSRQLLESGRHAHLRELEGQVAAYRADPAPAAPREARFSGALFALTGPRTFSAAADLAAAISDFGLGTVIGEPTGGVRESFGDSLRFVTPHAGIAFAVSTKRYRPPRPAANDETQGTTPHAWFDAAAWERHRAEPDPELAFALKTIAGSR